MIRKKVFFLAHAPYESGAEKVLKNLVNHLPTDEFEYHLVVPGHASWLDTLPEHVVVHPFTIHWQRYQFIFPMLFDAWRLLQFFKREQPDIIHANSRVSMLLAGVSKIIAMVTNQHLDSIFIAHVHDLDPLPVSKWKLIHQFDYYIAISEQVRQFLLHGKVDASRICLIYNGVDLEQYHSESPSNPDILFIGQVYPRKGLDLLIRALSIVQKKVNDVRLHIIGRDPTQEQRYRKEYEELSTELGVSDSVEFLGFISTNEVIDYLASCSLLCVPSREEPFGLVAIEAMAASKPVVATNLGGLQEIVANGETGALVESENIEQLSDAMIRILTDPDLQKSMGEKGRKRVEDKFSIDVQVERVNELYRSVI